LTVRTPTRHFGAATSHLEFSPEGVSPTLNYERIRDLISPNIYREEFGGFCREFLQVLKMWEIGVRKNLEPGNNGEYRLRHRVRTIHIVRIFR
jgi:hypothetical protein